jgi:hypothetical protein
VGPTKPPIQWAQVAVSPKAKRPVSEPDHALHLVPRLRMSGAVPSILSPIRLWRAKKLYILPLNYLVLQRVNWPRNSVCDPQADSTVLRKLPNNLLIRVILKGSIYKYILFRGYSKQTCEDGLLPFSIQAQLWLTHGSRHHATAMVFVLSSVLKTNDNDD